MKKIVLLLMAFIMIPNLIRSQTDFTIKKVVFGKVDSASDFSATMQLRWDTDSLYAIFNVIDDSVVGKGGANYQVDNIEFYHDLNNSKNVHWPRGGGWVGPVDAAYDSNDYQFRLVPDSAFAKVNSKRPGGPSIDTGYYVVYQKTDSGYKFTFDLSWKALDSAFVPTPGKLIGLDALISDQDSSVVGDKSRNQITFNSPSLFLYNDPSLWGTVRIDSNGMFTQVFDTTPPSAPTNLKAVAAGANVTLTWVSSKDSTAVMSYIIFKGTDSIANVTAKDTGNTYNVTGLTAGKYTFGVIAVDNSGNRSKMDTTSIQFAPGTGIKETGILFTVSPNPMTNELNINSQNLIKTVIITNVSGQIVENRTINSNQVRLDVSGLQSGLYFVRVQTDKGYDVKRVIKK
jgi:hypothetical protein